MCLCYAGFGQHDAHSCSQHSGNPWCTIDVYPYPKIKTQPNGEQITIKMFGNATAHYVETLDGYTITKDRNDGFYKYLVSDNEGDLLLTDIVAHNADSRSQKELRFLNTIPQKLRITGQALERKQNLMKSKNKSMAPAASVDFPSFGVRKALMLLVDFPDQLQTHSVNELDNLMNQPGYNVNGNSGSFRDYYMDISYGNLTINTDVVGWHTASQNKGYYGAEVFDPVTGERLYRDSETRALVREAVDAAEAAGMDFSQYDNDGNGEVDVVMLIHSGQGQEASGEGDDIWSHRWNLFDQKVTYDGVLIDKYIIQPETLETGGDITITTIGVVCHEFGHALGLPDLYGNAIPVTGLGKWSVMASGTWNNRGKTPSQMCVWSKAQLGWVTPTVITSTQSISNMSTIDVSTDCYRLNTPNGNEHFLISARQQNGWDSYLPGEGLAIWHIDDTKDGNFKVDSEGVYLEQADGLNELVDRISNAGDLFPGSTNNTSFDDTTTPNANTDDGNASGNCVSNISTTGAVPNLKVGFDVDCVHVCPDGDNDGVCTSVDCDDTDATIPTQPGTACDDGNPTSINDLIQSDGCTCQGTPTSLLGYCVPNISNDDKYISGVFLQGGGISHTSGNEGGYRDFTSEVAPGNVTKSATYTLNLQKTSEPDLNFYWGVWIDYNQDGDFEDANEQVLSKGSVSEDLYSSSITIDANALTGNTVMRVYLKRYISSDPIPCGNDDNVEADAEDYLLNISDTGGCTDADNDGVCAADDCDDNDATIPATPGTACNDGDATTTNDVIQADGCTCQGTTTPSSGYCTPNVSSSTDNYISGIVLGQSLINNGSGNDGGYRDFTTDVAPGNITLSTTYNLNLYKTSIPDLNFYWKVWIDYNQDGIFDDNTEVALYQPAVSEDNFAGSITVPANALTGNTRMRVYLKRYIGSAPIPCGNDDNVEADVEDYLINISGTGQSNYCTPNVPTNSNDVYIYRVKLNGFVHDSGNEGYGDFTTVGPAYVSQSEAYTLHAYKPTDDNSVFYWRVWIDYNQDGDFDDTDELIIHKVNHSERYIIETFTVPANVPNGATRMRIHLREYISNPPDPCGNNDGVDSEIEDYTVIIGADECVTFHDISGTVTPGIYKAADYIESDGQVLAGNTVTFQAGNLVHLKPGFIATAGNTSKFHALIDDCTAASPKEEIVENEPAIRNYPNPFTGQTTIEFTLPKDSPVTLFVTDAMGRQVEVLMNHETSTAGTHQVIFDGNQYAAGMYYYTLQAGEYNSTQKMILIK